MKEAITLPSLYLILKNRLTPQQQYLRKKQGLKIYKHRFTAG